MIESMLVFLLVLTGIAAGWFLGRRSVSGRARSQSPDWIPSVELILSQNSDMALKRLANIQSLDDDMTEIFINLGKSLREKGEVERAIHLHQNLFARTDLSKHILQELELELALDYSMAGLHDRAERLLLELLAARGKVQEKAAVTLIRLMEEEGEWQSILDLSQQKKIPQQAQLQRRVAHAACELAVKASTRGDYLETRQLCRQALKEDSRCARAYVVLGDMAYGQHEFNEAVRCYLKAMELDSGSVIALLDSLVAALRQLGDLQGVRAHLERHGVAMEYVPALVAKAQAQAELQGAETALQQFIDDLERNPSYPGYVAMLGLMLDFQRQLSESQAQGVYGMLQRIRADEPAYVCGHCGFKAKQFHWRCPSCSDWASLKAITSARPPSIAFDDL